MPLERIQKTSGALIAEGIRRCRSGELKIAAGYDGEFGTIKVFSPEERLEVKEQLTLFI